MKIDIFLTYVRMFFGFALIFGFIAFTVAVFTLTGCTVAKDGSTVTNTTTATLQLPKCEDSIKSNVCTVGSN